MLVPCIALGWVAGIFASMSALVSTDLNLLIIFAIFSLTGMIVTVASAYILSQRNTPKDGFSAFAPDLQKA